LLPKFLKQLDEGCFVVFIAVGYTQKQWYIPIRRTNRIDNELFEVGSMVS
jgi:hypothetical protein